MCHESSLSLFPPGIAILQVQRNKYAPPDTVAT
jgi:hypothetical protein